MANLPECAQMKLNQRDSRDIEEETSRLDENERKNYRNIRRNSAHKVHLNKRITIQFETKFGKVFL